ncbi:unnamed protein product [Rotaria sordida]|uniref:Uncharacterized protein n=2 Tax=Rotaria sordida TaxID=392033 RepID=A0A819FRH0_9BILA|nr:unnamed protein product [Rotaria sordida]CAF3664238.1 unnamed protein product [Rotaria sordida]CAF3873034.1 unnamed protein product [Rotaria sordida]
MGSNMYRRRRSYCSNELWMQIYTCTMATFLPSLINTVLNIKIFAYVRSSSQRIQPQVNVIPTNDSNNIQQPIISRWVPVYLTTIISYFVHIDLIILTGTAILGQLCILSIIINLFKYNHTLREYLINKIRQCIGL